MFSLYLLCPFLIKLFVFLLLSCRSSLYILDTTPLSKIQFINIFFHSVSCFFNFLDGVLFLYKFILFIYFSLHWVFVAVPGLSLVVASGGYSLLRCAGFSLRWLLLLWSMGSRYMGFSSCSTWAQ